MRRLLPAIGALAGLALPAPVSKADVAATLEAIARSDIRFLRGQNNAPFPPIGWIDARVYSETDFISSADGATPGPFRQSELNLAAGLPVYVGQRDLVFAGLSASDVRFDYDAPAVPDESVLTAMPVLGWLRQLDPDSQLGAFLAPAFTTELEGHGSAGAQLYSGLVGTTQTSDRWLWIYGAVYEYSFGENILYPYAGFVWQIDRAWSLSLIAPWPALVYAPTTDLFFQLGAEPGGATWKIRDQGREAVKELGGWDLVAAAGIRLHGRFWARLGAGYSGLRSLRISEGGDTRLETDINPHPMFTLAVQFRP